MARSWQVLAGHAEQSSDLDLNDGPPLEAEDRIH